MLSVSITASLSQVTVLQIYYWFMRGKYYIFNKIGLNFLLLAIINISHCAVCSVTVVIHLCCGCCSC